MTSHPPIPLYLSREQVREFLGLGYAETEKAWRHLAVYQAEGCRTTRVSRDELIAWIEARRFEKGQVRAA